MNVLLVTYSIPPAGGDGVLGATSPAACSHETWLPARTSFDYVVCLEYAMLRPASPRGGASFRALSDPG
jgi:hypothetical protein